MLRVSMPQFLTCDVQRLGPRCLALWRGAGSREAGGTEPEGGGCPLKRGAGPQEELRPPPGAEKDGAGADAAGASRELALPMPMP